MSSSFQQQPQAFEWINKPAALKRLCEQWQDQAAIALDTEFVRSTTFYPKPGLIQVADKFGIYLVDPLAIRDASPLAEVLANPHVVKVMHACSEDLEVFHRFCEVVPASIFDTQIAAAFCGYGASIGYANLLREMDGLDIPKQETRSDWLRRPLSEAQLKYAALDVEHLLGVYQRLVEQLEKKERFDWVESDCELLVGQYESNKRPEAYFPRIKMAWKLKPNQLAVLQALSEWREIEARKLNVPRNRVFKDHTLLEMASSLPNNFKQLQRVKDFWRGALDKYGKTLLSLIANALEDESAFPDKLDAPLDREAGDLFKKIKQQIKTVAEPLGIPPELLARKKDIEYLLRSKGKLGSYQLPDTLLDWRKDVIGVPLLAYLEQQSGEEA